MIIEGDTPCVIIDGYTGSSINGTADAVGFGIRVAVKENVAFVSGNTHASCGCHNGATGLTAHIFFESDIAGVLQNRDVITGCIKGATIGSGIPGKSNAAVLFHLHSLTGVNSTAVTIDGMVGVKYDVAIARHINIAGLCIKSTAISIAMDGVVTNLCPVIREIKAAEHIGAAVALVVDKDDITSCENSTASTTAGCLNTAFVIAEGNAGISLHPDISIAQRRFIFDEYGTASITCRTITERNGFIIRNDYISGITVNCATISPGCMIREGDIPIISYLYTIIGSNRSAITATTGEFVAFKENGASVSGEAHASAICINSTTVLTTFIIFENYITLGGTNPDAVSCVNSTTSAAACIIFKFDMIVIIAEGHIVVCVNSCTTPVWIIITGKSNAAVIVHDNITGMDGTAFVQDKLDI